MSRTYWFVRLQRALNMGYWPASVLLFASLVLAFIVLFQPWRFAVGSAPFLDLLGSALFFSFVNAYATVGAAYVIARSGAALEQLRPLAGLDDNEFAQLRRLIEGTSLPALLGTLAFATAFAIGHNLLLLGGLDSALSKLLADPSALGSAVGASLTWLVLTTVIWAFVSNARLFARLGRERVDVELATPATLAAFGTISLLPTLGLVGTQAAYPLLSLGGSFNAAAVLPGFVATLVSLAYLFVHPTWPLHRRLKQAKLTEMRRIEREIAAWRQAQPQPPPRAAIEALHPQLAYREYVATLPVWPFDLSFVAKWGFYLIIPPLTWVAAAMVEMWLERTL